MTRSVLTFLISLCILMTGCITWFTYVLGNFTFSSPSPVQEVVGVVLHCLWGEGYKVSHEAMILNMPSNNQLPLLLTLYVVPLELLTEYLTQRTRTSFLLQDILSLLTSLLLEPSSATQSPLGSYPHSPFVTPPPTPPPPTSFSIPQRKY